MSPLEQDTPPAPVKAIKPAVAWKVDGGEHSKIVFHHHGLAARREGANELDVEFELAICTRAREFDQYASLGEVPTQVLLDAGWFFYCHYCDATVRQNDDSDEERGPLVVDGDSVYCSQACQDNLAAERARLDSNFARFKESVIALRPDLTFTSWHGGYPMTTCRAHFRFPGSDYTGTILDFADGRGLLWSIPKADMAAWEAYEATRTGANKEQPHG